MLKKRLVLSRSVVVGNILADVNLHEYADTLPHNQTWWLYYFMLRLDECSYKKILYGCSYKKKKIYKKYNWVW